MASGERRAGPNQTGPNQTGPGQIGPATRVVVALGRPVQGRGAPRVESPERILRMWEMLNGVGDEINLQTMPPETLAGIRRLLKTVIAELQRSVSPPLAEELRLLIGDGDGGGAEASASELRIQYAGLLGWLGGLVISMYTQLQDTKRELLIAGHPGGADDPGSRAAGPGRAASGGRHGAGRN